MKAAHFNTTFDRRQPGRFHAVPISAATRMAVVAVFTIACGVIGTHAAAQLRIVTYNVADLEGNQSSMRFVLQSLSEDDAQVTTGVVRAPDIFVLQEVDVGTSATVAFWLNQLDIPGTSYVRGTFTANGGGGENAVIYNELTVDEDPSGHVDITSHSGPRATDRWKFSFVTQPSEVFYIYGSHLKADTGGTNEAIRLSEVTAIRQNADALGEGAQIIYCGDYNMYASSEPGFQKFFEAGPGQAADPRFAGSFTNVFAHTQSPHDGSEGLTTGGMDDRFDFQLVSTEFIDDSGLEVDQFSYRSFGNDGSHFNKAINDGFNFYFLPDEQEIKADALAKASDHVPVVADYFRSDDPFTLEVPRLDSGQQTTLTVRGGQPNKKAYFVYSLRGMGEFFSSQLNITLRLQSPKLAASRTTNSSGVASLNATVPAGLADKPVWFQVAQQNQVTDVVLRVVDE